MTALDSDVMTLQEASRCLFVEPRSVQKWAGAGRLETVKVGRVTYFTRESVVREGLARGMTEEQVLSGRAEHDEDAAPPQHGPPRFKPMVWPTVSNSVCRRCGKRTPRGWCPDCGGDYD